MFYHKKMPVKMDENFIMSAEIELLVGQGYGQFGLVWGFDKEHEVVNRFIVSVESKRLYSSKCQMDHYKIFHCFIRNFERSITPVKKQLFRSCCWMIIAFSF